MDKNELRKFEYTKAMIKKYNLDLTGMTVFTELADGNYFYTSIAAVLAGAKRVWAYTPSNCPIESKKINLIFEQVHDLLKSDNSKSSIFFATDFRDRIAESDIITNSGKVRPITICDLRKMKKSTVIALMMQSDQVRKKDVDIIQCINSGIWVAPVEEAFIGIHTSIPFKVMKALFAAGLSVWQDKHLICGNLQEPVTVFFKKNGISIKKFNDYLNANIVDLKEFDTLIVHDYFNDFLWVGNEADNPIISIEKIKKENPLIKIVNISGNVDVDACLLNSIDIFPLKKHQSGKTTLSGDYLSYKVTIELNVAGLKAAENCYKKRIAINQKKGGN